MASEITEWLLKTRYTETQNNFRTLWDFYLKFYTVFLTANVAALAWVYSHAVDEGSRWPVAIAFIIQCSLVLTTSALMALQSTQVTNRTKEIVSELGRLANARGETWDSNAVFNIDLPVRMARYSGWANCLGVSTLGCIWLVYALHV